MVRHKFFLLLATLAALTVLLAAGFDWLGVSSSILIGAIFAGAIVSISGGRIRIPGICYNLCLALIGCLISSQISFAVFRDIGDHLVLHLVAVLLVAVIALAIGCLITISGKLEGTTGLWGMAPGGATVMVLMSEAYGANMQLVALMQYLRVFVVSVMATLLTAFLSAGKSPLADAETLQNVSIDPLKGIVTTVLLASGLLASRYTRLPAGALLMPLLLGTALQLSGYEFFLNLPVAMALAYVVLGWQIGLGFDRTTMTRSIEAFPVILLGTALLILTCFAVSIALILFAGIDPLTAFLAMSPGGMDAMVLIALATNCDVPFVVTAQLMRFALISVAGPFLISAISRRLTPGMPR